MHQVPSSRTLFVGDSLEDDVEAAKLVGIHPELESARESKTCLRQVFDYIRD